MNISFMLKTVPYKFEPFFTIRSLGLASYALGEEKSKIKANTWF